MKKFATLLSAAILTICTAGAGFAVTQEEVKAFVDEAASYIKANGRDAAMAEFNKKDGKFVRGELYVFALQFDGTTLANGGNPKMVGKNLFEMNLKDANGKMFMQEMGEIAKSKGAGWTEYSWTNPETKKVQAKVSYIRKIDDKYFIGAGAYK